MKFIVFILLIIIGVFIYMKLNPIKIIEPATIELSTQKPIEEPIITHKKIPPKSKPIKSKRIYKCDGRTHCSHMRSCEEATFFIRNCRGTKMDGDGDGVPCERQWCH